jgi:protein TonB
MKTRIALLTVSVTAAAVLAACASRTDAPPPAAEPRPAAPAAAVRPPQPAVIVPALSLDEYKLALAKHIAQKNAAHMHGERPQALLRSVVVLRYAIDARGNLLRSEIMRSNRDRQTEATALATLRRAAPFPPPSPQLLQQGRLEIAETWLFNNDGRFQLRTTALPQMNR